jgi:uncharacterized membrane protein
MVQLVNKRVMEDRLDLFWIISLIAIALSNLFIALFYETEMWIAACVALGVYVLSLVTWIVLFIIKIVRFRKQVKRRKQGNY